MMRVMLGVVWLAVFLLAGPARGQEAPRLDVAFLLDATGSMGDEIDAVKERIRDMIAEIAVGDPAPDVRFGIVAYRDRGDEYVTKMYPLTRDIDHVVADLDQIQASGGGDYPESLNEALHTVLHDLNWDPGAQVGRLVFLIADAPPHLDYPDDFDYVEEYQMAAERGVTVHAVGASGLDESGERIFREIAAGTGGDFQWLAYESRYVAADGEEVIAVTEGRSTTFTKGDSTWTEEGAFGGAAYADVRDGVTGEVTYDKEGGVPVPSGGTAPAGTESSTSTNLADLITAAVKDAAEEKGVKYDDPTAVEQASWGQVKRTTR